MYRTYCKNKNYIYIRIYTYARIYPEIYAHIYMGVVPLRGGTVSVGAGTLQVVSLVAFNVAIIH